MIAWNVMGNAFAELSFPFYDLFRITSPRCAILSGINILLM